MTGSEIDSDDAIDDEDDVGSKRKSKKSTGHDVVANGAASDNEEKDSGDKLVKIDEDKITLLWSEFCKMDKVEADTKEEKPKVEEKKEIITKQYDFAGQTVVVQEEVIVPKSNVNVPKPNTSSNSADSKLNETAEEAPKASTARGFQPIKRTSGGLGSLLGQLKKPKMSTLTKSLHDWNDYKKKENLEDELDQHRRSKDSFLERQAFLTRTDNREFEHEKSVRDHERKVRQLSKPN